MEVKEIYEKYGYEGETSGIIIEMKTDEGKVFKISIAEGEQEDMTLNRDLSDAYKISNAILEAYECGKRGEELNYIFEEEND